VPTILLSAGDASGEAHAAELVRVLRRRFPDARFLGLGGAGMAAAGVELIADQRELAVGGLFEIAGSLGRVTRTWRAMGRGLRESQPDLVVLVDSGGFNLPFARRVRATTGARVLYYIAPQVWAWRRRRLRKLVARTDRIAVLFPFERDFYAAHDVEVDFVGHPILDHALAQPIGVDAQNRARHALEIEGTGPVLGLLPGSRRNEVASHLPLQLAAFARLRESIPSLADLRAVVGLAPSLDAEWVRVLVRASGAADSVRVAPGGQALFDAIDVALTKPGTNTVELMLRERPMVVMGRVHPITAAIVKRGLQVPWLSMPNLVAGEAIVPELLQHEATPDRIAEALAPLFPMAAPRPNPFRAEGRTEIREAFGDESQQPLEWVESEAARRQIDGLIRARARLGTSGATERVASLVEEMLETDRT
jgi:lipid-A-disaccharide synthase